MTVILRKVLAIISIGAIFAAMIGCDKIGQTPAGGSDAEVKAAFDKLPLDQRAKSIMGSPMPMDQKMKRIKDMYQKEGKEVPADLFGSAGAAAH